MWKEMEQHVACQRADSESNEKLEKMIEQHFVHQRNYCNGNQANSTYEQTGHNRITPDYNNPQKNHHTATEVKQ